MMLFDEFEEEDTLLDEEEIMQGANAALPPEELPPPRAMADCFGHEQIERTLLAQIQSNHLPHALIFSGMRGIGKATMAFRLTRYLLKESSLDAGGGLFGVPLPEDKKNQESLFIDPADPVFRQVASGGNPDMLTAERQADEKKGTLKNELGVEEIRRIAPFMRMTASREGGWRIAIVDDADTMTRSAQNALLKILEEPPPRALLILICHRLGAMIPTIRSRSRVFAFEPPGRDDFGTLIRREHPAMPQAEIDTLHAIAGGSVGQALRIAEGGGLKTLEKILDLLRGWPQARWEPIHMLAETVSRPGQEAALRGFEDILTWMIDSILYAKARGVPLEGAIDTEFTRAMLARFSLSQWIEIAGQLRTHFDTVSSASLDRRHAVLGAFSLLRGAA